MTGRAERGLRVFVVAGEASGDVLGAGLMAGLSRLASGGAVFAGVGGPMMATAGLRSLFPMTDLAVWGFAEVLPHLPRLLRRLRETARAARDFQPDVVVTVDAPGFNLRLADRLSALGCPRVHYVAPSVWVWKPNRVHAFRRRFDHLLALLPFEPPYFTEVGLPCTFVGHPVMDSAAESADGAAFRRKNGVASDAPVFCILPGSRHNEISRLLPVFRETARLLATHFPRMRIVAPVAPGVEKAVSAEVETWPGEPIIVRNPGDRSAAMRAANAALAASGTVALELARAQVPAVVAYRFSAVSHAILKRVVRNPRAHILNTMADRYIVPERIQTQCRPETLAKDLIALAGPAGKKQVEELRPLLDQLRAPGGQSAGDCAAQAVLGALKAAVSPAPPSL